MTGVDIAFLLVVVAYFILVAWVVYRVNLRYDRDIGVKAPPPIHPLTRASDRRIRSRSSSCSSD